LETKGRLFYIIGPSGAGKDSLISYARNRMNGESFVVFAHRYITRPPLPDGENHVALSEKEFMERLTNGFFAMHWQSHGYHYGIGIEVNIWLSERCHVVVNGSRAYLPEVLDRYPQSKVLLIDVSEAELKRRLQKRGRENAAKIQSRLSRNRQFSAKIIDNLPNITVIQNDGSLESAGKLLVQQIT
jgi:ribose 1,5-bisphosphokinase